jgi:hypothetical protein
MAKAFGAGRWLIAGCGAGALLLAVGPYALARQTDEAKRDRPASVPGGGTHHVLPATLETTQWGGLDPNEPPKLVVNSGDTVAVETSTTRSSREGRWTRSSRCEKPTPAAAPTR